MNLYKNETENKTEIRHETECWKSHTVLSEKQVIDLYPLLCYSHNSHFKFEGTHYHQISGCATGSPVGAVRLQNYM